MNRDDGIGQKRCTLDGSIGLRNPLLRLHRWLATNARLPNLADDWPCVSSAPPSDPAGAARGPPRPRHSRTQPPPRAGRPQRIAPPGWSWTSQPGTRMGIDRRRAGAPGGCCFAVESMTWPRVVPNRGKPLTSA